MSPTRKTTPAAYVETAAGPTEAVDPPPKKERQRSPFVAFELAKKRHDKAHEAYAKAEDKASAARAVLDKAHAELEAARAAVQDELGV